MTEKLDQLLDRRQLLARLTASAFILGAHDANAFDSQLGATEPAETGRGQSDKARILALRLLTAAPLEEMRAFYSDGLGLPVRARSERELVVFAGASEIVFVQVEDTKAAPFYHFAFNIPENKILAAREWQLERSEVFITPPGLRDPTFPDDVRHFRSWNAHSIFFWDPAGNVLEYIARHDLDNTATGGFSQADILYASEIGFVVDDVPGAAASMEATLDLEQYRNGSAQFHATGDEHGLLLLFERGREIGDVLRDRPAPVGVFETQVEIRCPGSHRIEGYPYEISGHLRSR